ncbi:MAG: hypothetical protein EKK46_09430 [Rhodocyclaceae bacterium]|nr:MAG: hypothetical protein EKK46_09430 [Rhodocyclaceae bacterium]
MRKQAAAAVILGMVMQVAMADSVKDYMIRAIDAGEISGVLTDATAKAWQQHSGSSAPVMIKVTPVKEFKQPGCKRLAVVLYQDGVPTAQGPKIRAGLPFEMNMCRDGTPPSVNELGGMSM